MQERPVWDFLLGQLGFCVGCPSGCFSQGHHSAALDCKELPFLGWQGKQALYGKYASDSACYMVLRAVLQLGVEAGDSRPGV